MTYILPISPVRLLRGRIPAPTRKKALSRPKTESSQQQWVLRHAFAECRVAGTGRSPPALALIVEFLFSRTLQYSNSSSRTFNAQTPAGTPVAPPVLQLRPVAPRTSGAPAPARRTSHLRCSSSGPSHLAPPVLQLRPVAPRTSGAPAPARRTSHLRCSSSGPSHLAPPVLQLRPVAPRTSGAPAPARRTSHLRCSNSVPMERRSYRCSRSRPKTLRVFSSSGPSDHRTLQPVAFGPSPVALTNHHASGRRTLRTIVSADSRSPKRSEDVRPGTVVVKGRELGWNSSTAMDLSALHRS